MERGGINNLTQIQALYGESQVFLFGEDLVRVYDFLQGKKGIWIKLPLGLANLVEPAVSVSCLYVDWNISWFDFSKRLL